MKKYKLPPKEVVFERVETIKDQLTIYCEGTVLTTKGIISLIYNIIEDYNKKTK